LEIIYRIKYCNSKVYFVYISFRYRFHIDSIYVWMKYLYLEIFTEKKLILIKVTLIVTITYPLSTTTLISHDKFLHLLGWHWHHTSLILLFSFGDTKINLDDEGSRSRPRARFNNLTAIYIKLAVHACAIGWNCHDGRGYGKRSLFITVALSTVIWKWGPLQKGAPATMCANALTTTARICVHAILL